MLDDFHRIIWPMIDNIIAEATITLNSFASSKSIGEKGKEELLRLYPSSTPDSFVLSSASCVGNQYLIEKI